MNIYAIGFDLSREDREQILKVMTGSGVPLPGEGNILDIKSVELEVTNADVYVIFGERAARASVQIAKDNAILSFVLPPIGQLYSIEKGGNAAARKQALSDLTSLRDLLATGHKQVAADKKLLASIDPLSVPNLTAGVVQALEKAVKEAGNSSWLCRTKDGKLVSINIDPGYKNPEAQINLSFGELLGLRVAMDIFKVSEIKFVPR